MAREYDIARPSGCCQACQRKLAAGEEFVAALFDGPEQMRREDFCLDCWGKRPTESAAAFSQWRGRIAEKAPSRKGTVVDDAVLAEFFNRLAEETEPAKVNFRFVLALMLMRKKVLVYEGSVCRDEREIWHMRFKNETSPVEVVNPGLDEAKISEVTEHLGAIFEVPQ